MPIDGFFEWKAIKGQKAKQLYAIAMKDGSPTRFKSAVGKRVQAHRARARMGQNAWRLAFVARRARPPRVQSVQSRAWHYLASVALSFLTTFASETNTSIRGSV